MKIRKEKEKGELYKVDKCKQYNISKSHIHACSVSCSTLFYFETFMLKIDVQGRLEYSKWTDFTLNASSPLMNELEFN